MRANDAISGAVLIIVACVMIGLTLSFPPFPGQDYGPSLFPRLLASGLILCGSLLIMRGIGGRRSGEPWLVRQAWTSEPRKLISLAMVPATVVIYILVSEQIGFLIVAFTLLLVLFSWFRTRPLPALLIAAVATGVVHYFFANLMRVPLPRGILTNLL